MPTYVLDGQSEARMEATPLSVRLGSTGDESRFVLEAVVADAGSQQPVITRPGMIVLPLVEVRTVIRVLPKGVKVFPANSEISLTIATDGVPEAERERVVISNVDVSGLSQCDLVVLEPSNGKIVATAIIGGPKEALHGLALRSRVMAREILGAEQVDASSAINMVIAIDGSASMLGLTRDGSVRAIVDVLVGVSQVVAPGRTAEAALITDQVSWVKGKTVGALSAALSELQEKVPLTTGFRSGHPGLIGRAPDQNTVTYVVTDGVPADAPALAAADEIDGEARHLVILGDASSFQVDASSGVTTTRVSFPPGDEAEHESTEPPILRALIISLLQGCFVPGTPFAKRVAS